MQSSIDVLSQSIEFGESFFRDLGNRTDLEIEHKVVASLFRKLIEQADACSVLAKHDLEGPFQVMKRAIFETFLAVKYILEKKEAVKDRAYSYYVGSLIQSINELKAWCKQEKLDMSDQELERGIAINSELLNDTKLKYILEEWKDTKRKLKKPHNPNWYSLFNGPRSLKQLTNILLGDEFVVYSVYGSLSQEAHSYTALGGINNIEFMDEPLELRPIRCKLDPNEADSIKNIFIAAMFEVIGYLFLDRFSECLEFAIDIGMLTGQESFLNE